MENNILQTELSLSPKFLEVPVTVSFDNFSICSFYLFIYYKQIGKSVAKAPKSAL